MGKACIIVGANKIEVEEGSSLKEPCERVGVYFACGCGFCGTCVIEVEDGMANLSEVTQEEIDFLGDEVGKKRLACMCKIIGGTVRIKDPTCSPAL